MAFSYREFVERFLELKSKCPKAIEYLEIKINFKKWSRAHIYQNRFDVVMTNIVESLNMVLTDEMEFHVAAIFNSIAKKFAENSGCSMQIC